MKKAIIASTMAVLLSTSAQADTLAGLYIGGHIWANQAKGVFGELNNQVDFNLEDEEQGSFFIALEHPLPFIPNVKISSTSLDTNGTATLESTFVFNDTTYQTSDVLNTSFDVSYVDYTLYYELFDNDLLTFDFGLTARDIDASINVNSSAASLDTTLSASGMAPMLYVSTIIGLPFTGFNVFAEGNFLSFDDNTLYDYQAGISYELVDNLAIDINLTLGYRAVKLELDDLDDLYTNLDFDGVFAGAVLHF